MAIIKKVNFSGGEIDPALIDRDNFEKHKAGLKTARNVQIGKTGRLVSKAGARFIKLPKYTNRRARIEAPKESNIYIEWGHEYVRVQDFYAGTHLEASHAYTENDLDDLHFEFSGVFLYIFKKGSNPLKLNTTTCTFVSAANIFFIPLFTGSPTWTSATTGTGTFNYEHIVTTIVNGEESFALGPATARAAPINSGEKITLTLSVAQAGECRVYRRPQGGRTFGYVGSIAAGLTTYEDFGEGADFSQTIPAYTSYFNLSTDTIINSNPATGIVYQQRLVTGNLARNEEAIVATRTGYQNNFSRDFPLSDDSALTFKCGTSGNAKIKRFYDGGPLIAWTTNGVYSNAGGPLTPNNAYMEKKADFVIMDNLKPLAIPGALLFGDKSTNTVRNLIYSQERNEFEGPEVSIFSDHLFRGRQIKAWTFQKGQIPTVHVIFDDGKIAYFTYQKEHEMQAWTRGDTDGKYIDCCTVNDTVTQKEYVVYYVYRNGQYMLEHTTDRFVNDLKELIQVDSAIYENRSIHGLAGIPASSFSFTPVGPNGWESEIRIDSTISAFAAYSVGDVFRMFDSEGSYYDLEVTQTVSDVEIIVTPDKEIPVELRTEFVLYKTFTSLNTLSHLEGKDVSIYLDGAVYASPYNDRFDTVTVVGGVVNFERAAFVCVGLPFIVDIETLDASTSDDSELDARIVNFLTVKTYNSKGFHAGQTFPDDNTTDGMVEPELSKSERVPYAPLPATIDTYTMSIPNDWDSKGRICIRSVDPVGLEILSLRPDVITPN